MNSHPNRWHPVAQSRDLVPRHVFHGQLHGVELALWRDDAGQANAWENRCPHRSVRFTLGVNLGTHLRCQYHGWQYRSEDGRCTRIPAISQSTPPASLCARGFAVAEHRGFIWVNLTSGAGGVPPTSDQLATPLPLVLRSLPFNSSTATLIEALPTYSSFAGNDWGTPSLTLSGDSDVQLNWPGGQQMRFWLQPLDESRTLVHSSTLDDGRPESIQLHWHNRALNALRHRLESTHQVRPAAIAPPRATELAAAPVPSQPTASGIAVKVLDRWTTGSEIVALKLAPESEQSFVFEAGAHIDVDTPSGFKRQYSLVNTPEERNHLLIGVKLEPASRGGSRSIHDEVVIGQTLRISPPRNNFRLQPQGAAVLIAGGIGITPLLAMGATLQAQARHYELHYFVRSEAHVAFPERLHLLRHNCIHTGLAPEQTRDRLRIILQKVDATTHLYVCGPKPLIDLVIDLAAHAGIGEERVHYELFANQTTPEPGRPFRVRLQRSGEEFEVPSTVSLAEALKARGIAIDTSCEQGVCGTCHTAVVDGTPEHRDLFLTREERHRNDCLMPCVSRSHSDLLVLDL